jgi:hypothetical protein
MSLFRRILGAFGAGRNHPRVAALREVKRATEQHDYDVARMHAALSRMVEAGNKVRDRMFVWKRRVALADRLADPDLAALAQEQLHEAMDRLEHLTEELTLNQAELARMEADQTAMAEEFFAIKADMLREGFPVGDINLIAHLPEHAERSVDTLMATFETEQSLSEGAERHADMADRIFASIEAKQSQ